MPIPQRLTVVTLGARSVARLRRFYRGWGWTENAGGSEQYCSFSAGSVSLALYAADLLRDEAAPGAALPGTRTWTGVTLAVNFAERSQVDDAVGVAVEAGAELVGPPVEREWGGYSAYVADPEGNRWELAWAPGPEPG